MPVPLDIITRKKLILVRQLYQRAVLQAEAQHSYVDRIMALIGLDLSNETILKTVVTSVDPSKNPATDFQGIVQQANNILAAAGMRPVPDQPKIQHVRTLRNDAQHKAKYPNDTDVNDCRTYTRDFLVQIISDVWGEKFESISLTDVIQSPKVKGYLVEAETKLAQGDYTNAVIKTIAGFDWTISQIRDSIVGRMPWTVRAFIVGDGFEGATQSTEIFDAFKQMQDIVMRSVIGLNFPSYLRYKRITRSVGAISFAADGNYVTRLRGHTPDIKEAEYVIEFAVNAVLQIESLVGDIDKPFEI